MNQEIHYFDCSEGSTNDVYQRFILKGTIDQVDKYLKDMIESNYDKDQIEELGGDPWGYGVTTQNYDIVEYEYFVDATELDQISKLEIETYSKREYNSKFWYHRIIDLTSDQQ